VNMKTENIDDAVQGDYDVPGSHVDGNNFVPREYFVTPRNIKGLLMERFSKLGIEVKHAYSTGTYCIVVRDDSVLEELMDLEYITLEKVGKVTALGQES